MPSVDRPALHSMKAMLGTRDWMTIMTRRKEISDESYGMLEEMDLCIDDIIKLAYNMYQSIHNFTPEVEEKDEIAVRIQHLVITEREMAELEKKYNRQAIDNIISAMRNSASLKKYKSGYLTANNWLRSRGASALKVNDSIFEVGSEEWKRRNS